ncbi:MAG: glycine cleavage system protein GcvH [Armatimonadota bacterium]|nr:glycine cleavage system protein GcvH [Armatimonadota bacterium]
MMYPEDYRYSKTHEWVSKHDNLATIGITDYAQLQLGDIVHLELPDVGAPVVAGAIFGSVDSVKAVSDLLSPVSGEVVEVNEDLTESPELINEEPHTAGWMIIVRIDDPSELDDMMSAEQYEEFVEAEI